MLKAFENWFAGPSRASLKFEIQQAEFTDMNTAIHGIVSSVLNPYRKLKVFPEHCIRILPLIFQTSYQRTHELNFIQGCQIDL